MLFDFLLTFLDIPRLFQTLSVFHFQIPHISIFFKLVIFRLFKLFIFQIASDLFNILHTSQTCQTFPDSFKLGLPNKVLTRLQSNR